ncbi:MAG: DUF169 domain-containing protein [Methanosarcinaceae archaeon]|nr:DUF169 domain-containing protein [Methanosarcinaceae archaeon]
MQPLQFPEIEALMEAGEPVCISFEAGKEASEASSLLFCEMVRKAGFGESFRVSSQRCLAGAYVLGLSEIPPSEYYLKSGRYLDQNTAEKAALGLPRIQRKYRFIKIEPLSKNCGKFDLLLLFLKPEKAMRVVQAFAYAKGARVGVDTIGAASICGDCTARALKTGLGLSFGCKGSRKHCGYEDTELPLGIAFEHLNRLELGLLKLPKTLA